MLIFGEGLDSPIAIPARNRKHNSPDVILNEIDKLKISDKYITLLSNPIRIIITAISPPKGKGFKKIPKYIDCNNKGRIEIKNKDEKCLLYALEIARLYANASENYQARNRFNNFYRILKNEKRQEELVIQLLAESNIQINSSGCGISELIQFQNFYDKKYPGMYRIILFNKEDVFLKPIWKGPRPRQHNLVLYLEEKHFGVIKNVPVFFKMSRKYCFDCEIPYNKLIIFLEVNNKFIKG